MYRGRVGQDSRFRVASHFRMRTNTYEERPWCVQEMDWAEDFGSPLVMVDARTQLVRAREFLPIGGSP